MKRKTVAVVGASPRRDRFSNKSVRAHQRAGYEVFPVNPRGGDCEGLTVYPRLAEVPVEHLDRVTVYVSPPVTLGLLDEIAECGCDELWLNPGTADAAVLAKADELGLDPILACSILDTGFSPADFPER